MRIENFPKLKRCDHSPKRDEFIDVSLDPPYFSLDSPFKLLIFLFLSLRNIILKLISIKLVSAFKYHKN